MTKFIRALTFLAVVTAAATSLVATSLSATAATPEEAYIAARDAAIAKVKAMDKAATDKAATDKNATDKANPASTTADEDATLAFEEKARTALAVPMRAIIGPVAIKGLEGEGEINLESLYEGDEGFGVLDGLVYGPVDGKTRVLVTTDGLLAHWLKNEWVRDTPDLPQDPVVVVKMDTFYTQAVQTDAAIMRFAELPVRKPAGAAFAFAMLDARSQDDAPHKADEVFVAVAQGGRVYIGYTREFKAVGPIPSCDKVRDDLVKKSAAAAKEPGLSDDARDKKSEALSAKAETEFLSCFAAKAPQQNGFAGAAAAAQALIDRLPLH